MTADSLQRSVNPKSCRVRSLFCRRRLHTLSPRDFRMNTRSFAIGSSVALAGTLLATACGSVTSRTAIDPGQAFRLGGGQPGAFTVRGSNSGAVPIVVFVDRNGTRDSITTVAPAGKIDATFPARSMAVFINRSESQGASVTVKITGSASSLGMGYEANGKH